MPPTLMSPSTGPRLVQAATLPSVWPAVSSADTSCMSGSRPPSSSSFRLPVEVLLVSAEMLLPAEVPLPCFSARSSNRLKIFIIWSDTSCRSAIRAFESCSSTSPRASQFSRRDPMASERSSWVWI